MRPPFFVYFRGPNELGNSIGFCPIPDYRLSMFICVELGGAKVQIGGNNSRRLKQKASGLCSGEEGADKAIKPRCRPLSYYKRA